MTWRNPSGSLAVLERSIEVTDEEQDYGCPLCDWRGYIENPDGSVPEEGALCQCEIRRRHRKNLRTFAASIGTWGDPGILAKINPSVGMIEPSRRKYRSHLEKNPECNSLCFSSSPGTGKTYCAVDFSINMMKKFHLRGFSTSARYFSSMVADQVRDIEAESYVLRIRREAREQNVFLCDDLGGERSGSSAVLQLIELIQLRFEKRYPTIITTNLSYEEMFGRYGSIPIHRMSSGGHWLVWISCDGPDLRAVG